MTTKNLTLTVSIHDTAPHTRGDVERTLDLLISCGVNKVSMLVIPDHPLSGPIDKNQNFVSWLHEMENRGHEIVLHGLTHTGKKHPWTNPVKAFFSRIYTRGCGEFYMIDKADALDRLKRGMDIMHRAGFNPQGFVAPAWLYGERFEEAAVSAGLKYYTTRFELIALPTKTQRFSIRAKAIVYSSSTKFRAHISRTYCEILSNLQKSQPLVRLAIHPKDILNSRVRKSVRNIALTLAKYRKTATYFDFLYDYIHTAK